MQQDISRKFSRYLANCEGLRGVAAAYRLKEFRKVVQHIFMVLFKEYLARKPIQEFHTNIHSLLIADLTSVAVVSPVTII